MAIQGLTPESFLNMQLNAGAFFENIDLTKVDDVDEFAKMIKKSIEDGKCLGATTGGGSFQAIPEVRQIEADGMRSPIIGSTVIDSWEVKLTTTVKEITQANMKRALITAEEDSVTGAIKFRNNLKPSDYIESLCWAGDLLDGRFVVIAIDNALNLTGANFAFQDKGEGSLPLEFRAHQADLLNMEYAPCEIYFVGKEVKPITGIALDNNNLSMSVGDTDQLTATITPADATIKTIKWESDDVTVATVDAGGLVTAIDIGTAKITAKAEDGSNVESQACDVTVA